MFGYGSYSDDEIPILEDAGPSTFQVNYVSRPIAPAVEVESDNELYDVPVEDDED